MHLKQYFYNRLYCYYQKPVVSAIAIVERSSFFFRYILLHRLAVLIICICFIFVRNKTDKKEKKQKQKENCADNWYFNGYRMNASLYGLWVFSKKKTIASSWSIMWRVCVAHIGLLLFHSPHIQMYARAFLDKHVYSKQQIWIHQPIECS